MAAADRQGRVHAATGARRPSVGLAGTAAFVLAACAPTFQPMGLAVDRPQLVSDAFVTADATRLPVRAWQPGPSQDGPPRAVIVAVHGFNDYSNAFAVPGTYFAQRGLVTVAYDQRGFGAGPRPGIWPGTATLVSDLRAIVAAVHSRYPGVPLYLLGESMGGAVAILALTEPSPPGTPPLDAAGVILVAPALWGRSALTVIERTALWVSYHTVPWLEVTAPSSLRIMPSDNIPMLRALSADPLVIKATRIDSIAGLTDLMTQALARAPELGPPTLVLYGRHEQILPKRSVDQALAALPPHLAVAIYPDGYHMLLRDLHGATVLADIVSWIERPQTPLPSGADHAAWSTAAAD